VKLIRFSGSSPTTKQGSLAQTSLS